jgi:deoxyribonuclease V
MRWPRSTEELERAQLDLAVAEPEPFAAGDDLVFGGCWVCFTRDRSGPGVTGEPGWAAAAVGPTGSEDAVAIGGAAGAGYEPEFLALREGALLEGAVRALPVVPEVLLVNASGRDHSRRAGLALHLGAVLDVPTVGVTRRPLRARGDEPAGSERGATAPLHLEGDLVGYMVRTRAGSRALAVHAAWRTDPDTAVAILLAASGRARTPEPLRVARRLARVARAWCAAGARDLRSLQRDSG